MIEAYPRKVIRAAEAEVVASRPTDQLMKKAAGAVCDTTVEFLLQRSEKSVEDTKILGLVGGGDNGGDCLFALAYLQKLGYSTRAVVLHPNPHRRALAYAEKTGVPIIRPDLQVPAQKLGRQVARLAREHDAWIDGLIGSGIVGEVRSPLAQVIADLRGVQKRQANRTQWKRSLVVAIDLPSGIGRDDGQAPAALLQADVTVTMGGRKTASLLPPACLAWGQVRVVDLGLDLGQSDTFALQAADVGSGWSCPSANDHKYTRGVVQVVAGSKSYPMTGVMCVGAAARSGIGMVRFSGPEESAFAVLNAFPETVLKSGHYQSLLVGPGIDPDDRERCEEAVFQCGQAVATHLPLVLDAGALDLYHRIRLNSPSGQLDYHAVLTPHAGEAAKLLSLLGAGGGRGGVSRGEIENAPLKYARQLAELTKATVVLKGAVTLVVSAQGTVFSCAEAPAWAGTAGSGDVLAGLIAGALAARAAKAQASGDRLNADSVAFSVASAVWVHGRAARLAARMGDQFGELTETSPYGQPIVASDICAQIPQAIGQALAAGREP